MSAQIDCVSLTLTPLLVLRSAKPLLLSFPIRKINLNSFIRLRRAFWCLCRSISSKFWDCTTPFIVSLLLRVFRMMFQQLLQDLFMSRHLLLMIHYFVLVALFQVVDLFSLQIPEILLFPSRFHLAEGTSSLSDGPAASATLSGSVTVRSGAHCPLESTGSSSKLGHNKTANSNHLYLRKTTAVLQKNNSCYLQKDKTGKTWFEASKRREETWFMRKNPVKP